MPRLSGVRRSLPKELRKFLAPLIEKAQSTQTPLYLVGGCVRDLFLGKMCLDVDVVAEGLAAPLAKAAARLYKTKLITHEPFLTHTLLFSDGRHLDIATARSETYPEPAALPIVEPASLQDDLYRRDFSINAIALSLNAEDFGQVWDPFGGVEDLRNEKIRAFHSESFKDDPTRLFRAARFAGRFGYDLEWRTREWLMECINEQLPSRLSGARVREELIPLLMEKDPCPAFRLLAQWGALSFLIPNLKWEKSHETFFSQWLRRNGKGDSLMMRLLILLHAIPYPKAVGCLNHLMFPQKMVEQIEQALAILARLREGALVPAEMPDRKTLSPEVEAFIGKAVTVRQITPRKTPAEQWQRYQDSVPCLCGKEIRNLGYKPGPMFTKIFDALRQARWEGKLRTREEEIRFITETFPLNA
ncbi:MAG: hypothetical protein WC859_05805 [Elusimicrobiota bacterium]